MAPLTLLLQLQPDVLARLNDSDEDTGLGPGIIAVSPTLTSEAFSLGVDVPSFGAPKHKPTSIKVKATRLQVPLVIQNASTLYMLQGATADPGLIFHWRFPISCRKRCAG